MANANTCYDVFANAQISLACWNHVVLPNSTALRVECTIVAQESTQKRSKAYPIACTTPQWRQIER